MISTSFAIIGYITPHITFAQAQFAKLPNPLGGAGINTTADAIDKITTIFMTVAVPFVTIMIMYAGFKYVVAYGNPEKIKAANKRALWTLVGTILLFGATTIGNAIIKTIKNVTTSNIPTSSTQVTDPNDPNATNSGNQQTQTTTTPPTTQSGTTALSINTSGMSMSVTPFSSNGSAFANTKITIPLNDVLLNNDQLTLAMYIADNNATGIDTSTSRIIIQKKDLIITPDSTKNKVLTIDNFGNDILSSKIRDVAQANSIDAENSRFRLYTQVITSGGKEYSLYAPVDALSKWDGYSSNTQTPPQTNTLTVDDFPMEYTSEKGNKYEITYFTRGVEYGLAARKLSDNSSFEGLPSETAPLDVLLQGIKFTIASKEQ